MQARERLDASQAVLVVIDIQGRLAELMCNAQALQQEARRMIGGAKLFELPILWTEQIPEKLGPTPVRLRQALEGHEPIAKRSFSVWGEPAFREQLAATGRSQVMLIGMEAHVCVWQSAVELLEQDFRVWAIGDAIGSRHPGNRELGLARMQQAGVHLSSVEMALFEMQGAADDSDRFRSMVKLFR